MSAETCGWCHVPKGWHSEDALRTCRLNAVTMCAWCLAPLAEHDADELAECRAHIAESEGETDEERDELLRATAADEAHDAAREDRDCR